MVNGYSEAIKSLWNGLATVTVLDGEKLNTSNGRTEKSENILYKDLSCRLSHSAVKSTDPQSGAALITQSIVLYVAPEIQIPEGAKIAVTQNGSTNAYVRSGKPAIYTAHQEIPLELYSERA